MDLKYALHFHGKIYFIRFPYQLDQFFVYKEKYGKNNNSFKSLYLEARYGS